MAEKCSNCGHTNTIKTTDEIYYLTGQSHYCIDCEKEFTPDNYEDKRESRLGLQTGSKRLDYESDEDYQERMEDLDN